MNGARWGWFRGAAGAVTLAALGIAMLGAGSAFAAGTLSFDERVRARTAIERVYHAHRTGETRPFDEAAPRGVLEDRVRAELALFRVLEDHWGVRPTAEDLHDELARIAVRTRMPERLEAVYAALDHDPLLIEECFVRPLWTERLARAYFDADERIHADARREAQALLEAVRNGEITVEDSHPRRARATVVVDGGPVTVAVEGDLVDDAPEPPNPVRIEGEEWISLDRESFDARRAAVGDESGAVGELVTTPESFSFEGVLESDAERLVLASWSVPRVRWSDWWQERRAATGDRVVESASSGTGPLPAPGATDGDGFADAAAGSCEDGTWQRNALENAPPSRRHGSVAVWTGTEVIVWGGTYQVGGPTTLNSGRRFDPLTDRWYRMSAVDAPTASPDASAFWTGAEMIVWSDRGAEYSGIYDPQVDRWRPLPAEGAPHGRLDTSAIWAGDRLLVWGGYRTTPCEVYGECYEYFQSGAGYDPVRDAWSPMSANGAPPVRRGASIVWTGDYAILWGGVSTVPLASTPEGIFGPVGDAYDLYVTDGGRFDPVAGTWSYLREDAVPGAREGHHAVWTGSEMLVWGGRHGAEALSTGGRFDPWGGRWEPLATSGAPAPRTGASPVWTGEDLIVWGGRSVEDGAHLQDGARYSPAIDAWTPIDTITAPSPRDRYSAVWSGSHMIVWGGYPNTDTGGRYDPSRDRWTPTHVPLVTPWGLSTTVWTGSEMIVWGGPYASRSGRFDPVADAWRSMSAVGAPEAYYGHTSVWTGREMIVWGGSINSYNQRLDTGGRYDPIGDAWTATSRVGAPSPRGNHTAVWTGTEMIVWGGDGETRYWSESPELGNGARYDPRDDRWRAMAPGAVPRQNHTTVWTGAEMIVWGGHWTRRWVEIECNWFWCTWHYWSRRNPLSQGFRYDPHADTWTAVTEDGQPEKRTAHAAVWSGSEMIVLGGHDCESSPWGGCYPVPVETGGRYDPRADRWLPVSEIGAPDWFWERSATWTGTDVLVLGGASGQGGGHRYDPRTDRWTAVSAVDAPVFASSPVEASAGGTVLFWGSGNSAADGGAFVADGDEDGVCFLDNCIDAHNPGQDDRDGDGFGDACDACPDGPGHADFDGDALCDAVDNCPVLTNPEQSDVDADGNGDGCDNCPGAANPEQEDRDRDRRGDACDNCPDDANGDQADTDRDELGDACDNCPEVANTGQDDLDRDRVGDACDPCTDRDRDGFGDPGFPATTCGIDNCPRAYNPGQDDVDVDGIGDACDPCVFDPDNDVDGDGRCSNRDNCPQVANPEQHDSDRDGEGNACDACTDTDHDGYGNPGFPASTCSIDNCPYLANPDQADLVHPNGVGDACDDPDADRIPDSRDNCPDTYNPGQADLDEDGQGDPCDPDDDGDGIPDEVDTCPRFPDPEQDPSACEDADGDGVIDPLDNCPAQPNPYQVDSDGDGFGNTCDNCYFDYNPDQRNTDGDSQGDVCDFDDDGDGVLDTQDNCPLTPNSDQSDIDAERVETAGWASSATASSEYGGDGYSAMQATGPATVGGCSDAAVAWAPLEGGDAPEWLEVRYDTASTAIGVRVYENHVGGFVTRIELVDVAGARHVVWEGDDPTPCGGVFAPEWPETTYEVVAVRVHTRVDGWEEIDAVERVGLTAESAPDGIGDVCDNCPTVSNADQADADGNGIGDACES